ncbi:MAG TPA: YHS domain-containing protein [Blastocatellia bacterium]|nr:YHS domain-containing protein [Blastocatellia bacterium]
MRKFAFTLFLVSALAVVGAAKMLEGEAKKPVTNKRCPVMNSEVSEKFRAEYKGQYVYFCCQGCITMFEKSPETYIAKLSKEDQDAIKPNELCPMTNEHIHDQTRWIEHEGRRVYFCCDGCKEGFKEKIAAEKKGS